MSALDLLSPIPAFEATHNASRCPLFSYPIRRSNFIRSDCILRYRLFAERYSIGKFISKRAGWSITLVVTWWEERRSIRRSTSLLDCRMTLTPVSIIDGIDRSLPSANLSIPTIPGNCRRPWSTNLNPTDSFSLKYTPNPRRILPWDILASLRNCLNWEAVLNIACPCTRIERHLWYIYQQIMVYI